MFGKNLTLFTVFGFKVRVNLTWTFLALLIAWSLAAGVFPALYEGLRTETYWLMAVIGVVGLFFSIVVHELSHSLVARQFGMEMKGITLFLFGGVAEMEDEPPSPRAEFLMAIAGPLTSVVVAAAFYLASEALRPLGAGPGLEGVLRYLGLLNLVLAAFNMIPAFPLDGGRALRAALWHFRGNLHEATRIASTAGTVFGYVLMGLGVLSALAGNLIGGIWWFLLGIFVRTAAQSSFQRLETNRVLEGRTVRDFMTPDPVTVPPDITLRELVDDYVFVHHHDMFPVIDRGTVLGWVGPKHVKPYPREEWDDARVRDVVESRTEDNTVAADSDAMAAMSKMNGTRNSRLLVVDGDRLAGVITLKDIMKLLELHMDLDAGRQGGGARA